MRTEHVLAAVLFWRSSVAFTYNFSGDFIVVPWRPYGRLNLESCSVVDTLRVVTRNAINR
jgi:hypothetical protein